MNTADKRDIELKQIEIKNYSLIKKYFDMRRPQTSDSNIFSLYLWKECYPTWYFTTDKGLIWIAKSDDGSYYSSVPCCKNENLMECFKETELYFNNILKRKLTMYLVDREALDLLNLPEDKYVVVRDRTYDDYIYDAEKLRTLSGRKYHKKKNHLNGFLKEYEDRYEFKMLDAGHKDEIFEFMNRWLKSKEDTEEHKYIEYEAIGIGEILEHMDVLDFKIGGVYVDGRLEAFTIGNYSKIEDMVYIPVEKANHHIRGLYTYINSQFLIEAFPEAGKVNREDDMGLEGLRKAKMSYNPIYMVEKYTIIQK